MPRQKAETLAVGDTVRLLKGAHEGAVGVVLEKTGGGWMKVLTPLGTVKVQGRASVDKVDQVAAGKENAGTAAAPLPPPAAVTPPTPPVVSLLTPPVVMPPTPPVVSSPAPPAAPQAATPPQTARPQPTPPTPPTRDLEAAAALTLERQRQEQLALEAARARKAREEARARAEGARRRQAEEERRRAAFAGAAARQQAQPPPPPRGHVFPANGAGTPPPPSVGTARFRAKVPASAGQATVGAQQPFRPPPLRTTTPSPTPQKAAPPQHKQPQMRKRESFSERFKQAQRKGEKEARRSSFEFKRSSVGGRDSCGGRDSDADDAYYARAAQRATAGVFQPTSHAALLLGRARHYVALGLPATAATPEIKRSFRDLARAHHPDRHVGIRVNHLLRRCHGDGVGVHVLRSTGHTSYAQVGSTTADASTELFKGISSAYEALRDGDSRKAYQRAVLAGREK